MVGTSCVIVVSDDESSQKQLGTKTTERSVMSFQPKNRFIQLGFPGENALERNKEQKNVGITYYLLLIKTLNIQHIIRKNIPLLPCNVPYFVR